MLLNGTREDDFLQILAFVHQVLHSIFMSDTNHILFNDRSCIQFCCYIMTGSTNDLHTTLKCCMVVPMVFVMSLYGGLEACVKSGAWSQLLIIWLTNIPKNIIMALPFQLIVAGPLVRRVFRTAFPEGTVLQEPVM